MNRAGAIANAHPWIDPRRAPAADPAAVDTSSPAVNPARGGSIQRLDQSPDALINPAAALGLIPTRRCASPPAGSIHAQHSLI
eukprot:4339260-Prymnesium_polylepis.1